MPVPFYIYCIGFSFLVGIAYYPRLKPSHLHLFIPYLGITLATELAGLYTKYVLDVPNGWLYNGYLFVQVVFCCLFFRGLPMRRSYHIIIQIGLGLYVLTTAYNYIFVTDPRDFNIWLFLFGGFLVVLFALFFLFNYFTLDDRKNAVLLEPVMWAAAGLIAYFTVLSITVSLIRYILYYNLEIGGVKLHNALPRFMSVILYLCLAYSFYRCRAVNQK